MAQPLMPKATAVWLIENTALSFDQISEFCGLHILEVQSIADDEVAVGMVGFDPIANGQLTQEEIARCSADPAARLDMAKPSVEIPEARHKGPRYTPVARRQDRPDAIAWMLRNYPELSDGQVSRLIGTTKPTINAVRERTHWNIASIKPRDPVSLGLCGREELAQAIDKARRAAERAAKRAEREKARKEKLVAAEAVPSAEAAPSAGAAPSAEPAAEAVPSAEAAPSAEPAAGIAEAAPVASPSPQPEPEPAGAQPAAPSPAPAALTSEWQAPGVLPPGPAAPESLPPGPAAPESLPPAGSGAAPEPDAPAREEDRPPDEDQPPDGDQPPDEERPARDPQ